MVDGKVKKGIDATRRKWYNIGMKKEIIKVRVNQTELPNKFHFEVQKNTRMNVFRDRKKYRRKIKHKGKQTENE